jgi:hypothetical protein
MPHEGRPESLRGTNQNAECIRPCVRMVTNHGSSLDDLAVSIVPELKRSSAFGHTDKADCEVYNSVL